MHRPFRPSTCMDFPPNSYLYFPGGAWGAWSALGAHIADVFLTPKPLFLSRGAQGARGALSAHNPHVFFNSKTILSI